MQQASRPPSHRRWVWRSRRVCDVGDGSLPGATRLVQQIPRLLPAVEGVVPGRRRPVGQHRKGLVAGATTAPPNPDLLVPFVVRIFEALSVTDDGPLAANRAQPGEQFQRDLGHPGSVLFSGSGSAIKRITAGVKAGPDRGCQVSIWWLAFTLQVKSVPNEKRISRSAYCPHDLVSTLAGLKRLFGHAGFSYPMRHPGGRRSAPASHGSSRASTPTASASVLPRAAATDSNSRKDRRHSTRRCGSSS